MNRTFTAAATTVLATALLGLAGPVAQADAAPAAGSPGDAGAAAASTTPRAFASDPGGATARAAASSPAALALTGRFFAAEAVRNAAGRPAGLTGAAHPAAAPAAVRAADAARVSGPTVEVDTLNPAFVAGEASAPVAVPAFWATKAIAADGRTASVWTVRSGDTWRVVNIAAGADESDFAATAAASGGGTVFREPQINAWYVVRGGRVLPLDAAATASVGAHGVSLTAYRRLVHGRYADKLPGSSYDRLGAGGGFQATVATSHRADRTTATAAGATALGLALAAAGALTMRRRRAARS